MTLMQALLTKDSLLKQSPVHAILDGPKESIVLRPLVLEQEQPWNSKIFKKDEPKEPRVLVSVFVNSPEEPVLQEWQRWLTTNTPPGIYRVQLEGVFRSESTMLLLSIPAFEWSSLADKPAYRYIGFINSPNLLSCRTPELYLDLMPKARSSKVEEAIRPGKAAEKGSLEQIIVPSFRPVLDDDPDDDRSELEESEEDEIDDSIHSDAGTKQPNESLLTSAPQRLCDNALEYRHTFSWKNLWLYLINSHFPPPGSRCSSMANNGVLEVFTQRAEAHQSCSSSLPKIYSIAQTNKKDSLRTSAQIPGWITSSYSQKLHMVFSRGRKWSKSPGLSYFLDAVTLSTRLCLHRTCRETGRQSASYWMLSKPPSPKIIWTL